MATRPKDPCQRQACAIQDCLQKNNYQEDKCDEHLESLLECCRTVGKHKSSICKGLKNYETVKCDKITDKDTANN